MNQHARILMLALAVSSAGLAGCDRFKSEDKSPPYIVRVQLIDAAAFTAQPVIAGDFTRGAVPKPITFMNVPQNFATFRIDLSKPIDGSFVKANPVNVTSTTAPYCGSSPNVTLTVTPPPTTPPTPPVVLFAPTMGVCYNPSGLNANITVTVGFQTCAGIEPVPTLEPMATYTISGTGLKDMQGQPLPDFQVDVTAADFTVTGARVAKTYVVDPDTKLVRGDTFEDITGATPPADVPAGYIDAGSLQTKPTATEVVTTYQNPYFFVSPRVGLGVTPIMGVDEAFGAVVDVSFTSYMCATGYEILCGAGGGGDFSGVSLFDGDPAASSTTWTRVPTQILGDDGFPDTSGILRQHLVSRIPLEDGRQYVAAVPPASFVDFNYADWANTAGLSAGTGITATFKTPAPAAGPRVVWQGPYTTASTLPLQYPSLDPALVSAYGGWPFVGIAASEPLTAGTVTLAETGAGTPISRTAGTPGSAWSADLRGRTVAFEEKDTLPLTPGATYTVSATGLAVSGGLTVPSAVSYTFKTLPFDVDPSFPGFYGNPLALKEYSDRRNVLVGTFAKNAGNAGTQYKGAASVYGMRVPAAVAYDAAAAPVATLPNEGITIQPVTGTGASVQLYEGSPAADGTPPTTSVAGSGGYLLLDLTDAWKTNPVLGTPLYPGSFLAFMPTNPLKNGQAYTLVAKVVLAGSAAGTAPTQLVLPFSTTPLRVLSVRGSKLYPGYGGGPTDVQARTASIRTGTRDVVMVASTDAAAATRSLFVRTSGVPVPGTYADYTSPNATTDPILLYRQDPLTKAQTLVPIKVQDYLATTGFIQVNPLSDADITSTTQYTLAVTTNLKFQEFNADGTPAAALNAAPYSVVFTTADQKVDPITGAYPTTPLTPAMCGLTAFP